MDSNSSNKYVIFKLGEECYGVSIKNVISIERESKTTRIPNSPDYITGLINLRGDVIPVINLRKKLGMEENSLDNNSRIIIVKEKDVVIGLTVDSSSEVLEIEDENIDKPPATEDNQYIEYIKGIGKKDDRLVIMLDIEKTLEY